MIRELTTATADRAAWLSAWQQTGREPFAHPDYVTLFAGKNELPRALVDEQVLGTVLIPLVRRPLPEWSGSSSNYSDAVSPYGYGGPYSSGDVDWRMFYESLMRWMREQKLVSFFVRTALDHRPPVSSDFLGIRAVPVAENIVVDLTRAPEEQWSHYAHKVRKNVNKARRAGLVVRISEGFANLSSFLSVYYSTMDRRAAGEQYYFGEYFFEKVGAIVGSSLVADVLDGDGNVVSTELVLVSDRRLYSFLGGTKREAFVHAPNDLLKHEVVCYGHLAGLDSYVLGGGYQTGDGIFRYKRGFDVDGVVPFQGLQIIGDQEVYDALVRQWDSRNGEDDVNRGEAFFPAYRRPLEGRPDADRARMGE